jgi:hypothetical protein
MDYEVLNAGLDWLTCTAAPGAGQGGLEAWAVAQINQRRVAGSELRPSARLGYVGFTVPGFFLGTSEQGALVTMSGPTCYALGADCIALADNVSRLDLQVTVSSGSERPDLVGQHYRSTTARYRRSHRQSAVTMIENYPAGATMLLNKRCSDRFGRIYDKGVESGCAEPRNIFRYEVELKRKAAKLLACQVPQGDSQPSFVCATVHRFFSDRMVQPRFRPIDAGHAGQLVIPSETKRYLEWYSASVRQSIPKAIKLHGLPLVLEALGLTALFTSGGGGQAIASHSR